MKKVILLASLAFFAVSAFAQKANIQSAINYLKDKDVANAKKMIDEATKNESTINNAKAWFLKGLIYQAIGTPTSEQMPFITFLISSTNGEQAYPIMLDAANQFASSTPDAMDQSFEAYKKSIELNSKFSKDEYLMLLPAMIYALYNNGVSKMNDSKFTEAYSSFGKIDGIKQLDNGKLFAGLGQLDTLFAISRQNQASCMYQANKDNEALVIIEECLKNPITQSADIYLMATDIYDRQKNDSKWTETMKAAKAKYPKEKRIINNELIYYSKNNKMETYINSLKEAIALEPNKADFYIFLGETYYTMANPVDKATNKPAPKPENAKELEQNAVTNYTKASELDPKNTYPQFNLGLVYYNAAKEITDVMNKADDKKFVEMKPGRDALIEKALPYFEKTKTLIEAEGVKDENKDMYKNTISGLMQSYQVTGKAEKEKEMQKILSGVK